MTNKEILQKIIEKAKNNGFKLSSLWILCDNENWFDYREKIIFSHDFVKAFWGEELLKTNIFDYFALKLGIKYRKWKKIPAYK